MEQKNFRVVKYTTDGNLCAKDIGPVKGNSLWRNLVLEIGNGCELIERVPLAPAKSINNFPEGYDVVGDESGLFHTPKLNMVGSYLYGYQEHGNPVVGDILIVKNKVTPDGEDWVSMSVKEQETIMGWIKKHFDEMLLSVGFKYAMTRPTAEA